VGERHDDARRRARRPRGRPKRRQIDRERVVARRGEGEGSPAKNVAVVLHRDVVPCMSSGLRHARRTRREHLVAEAHAEQRDAVRRAVRTTSIEAPASSGGPAPARRGCRGSRHLCDGVLDGIRLDHPVVAPSSWR
jgi:hypothetical protein